MVAELHVASQSASKIARRSLICPSHHLSDVLLFQPRAARLGDFLHTLAYRKIAQISPELPETGLFICFLQARV